MPRTIDASLQAEAATRACRCRDLEEARRCVAGAIEEMPGDAQVIDLESHMREGLDPKLDAEALLLGTAPRSLG